jgi:hypothetical protein
MTLCIAAILLRNATAAKSLPVKHQRNYKMKKL